MEVAIADTGFVVALTNRSDVRHAEVRPIYLQYSRILLPQTVLVEVAYLVGREAGIPMVVKFLQGLPVSRFILVEVTVPDVLRTATILEQYADSKVDFVDATVMAIAERLGVKIVLTLDQRDFCIFRPTHCDAFSLQP